MNVQLISMKVEDFETVKSIYDHYALNTTATFHINAISIEELKEFIYIDHPKYKSFLIKSDQQICGYCYLTQFKKRQAYDRTAEITLFLKPEFCGKGIGKVVLNELVKRAKENEIHVLIGNISSDNTGSIKLFEKSGFIKCGHYQKVGQKFNKILDVVAYQKIIVE